MSELPLSSARLDKAVNFFSCQSNLLDEYLCKNFFDFIFSVFFLLIFNHDFIIYIDFTRIAASNAEVMASQIRSHRLLIQTFNILVLILYSKLLKNLASLMVFRTVENRYFTMQW